MNAREWLISTFMLMSVLLAPYAPAETPFVVAPTVTATTHPTQNFERR
jgi:hypothetical protein